MEVGLVAVVAVVAVAVLAEVARAVLHLGLRQHTAQVQWRDSFIEMSIQCW